MRQPRVARDLDLAAGRTRVVQSALGLLGAALGRRLGVLIPIPRRAPRDDVAVDLVRGRVCTCPSE